MPYVFVKKWGRGGRVYHVIAADGSAPLCGARLNEKYWTVGYKKVGTHKCRRCKKQEEQP